MEKHIVSIEIGGEKEEIMVGNDGRGWFAIEASWGMHDLNNIPDSWLRKTKALAVEHYLERRRDELIWEDPAEDIKALNESIYKLRREGLGEQMSKKRIEGIAVSPDLYPEYFEWLSTEIDRLKKERDEANANFQKILQDKEDLLKRARKKRLRITSQGREIASLRNDLRTVREDLIESRGAVERVRKPIKAQEEEIEELKSAIRNRDSKIESLEAAVNIQAKAVKDKDKEIKSKDEEIKRLKMEISWMISIIKWLEHSKDSQIDDRDKEIKRLESVIVDKDVELVAEQAHNKTLMVKEAEIEKLEAENDRMKEINDEIRVILSNIEG